MSSLETSVTLEDVFTVVEGKRVPLAPELAGYLSLEIADQSDAGGGEVELKTVFISEEGTVALVRPKKDNPTGDAEASVRQILTKLLEASGSSTPALSAAAKRKPVSGLPALVEELEAALIPVNRAAGRRALARLARETKRVTMGVGRNASVPPPGGREPDVSMRTSRQSFDDEAATIPKRANALAEVPEIVGADPKPPSLPPPPRVPSGAPTRGSAPLPPPPVKGNSGPPVVAPPPRREERAANAPPKLFDGDEVDSLLGAFGVSGADGEKQMSRDLKAIAGLDPTPPPPDARTLADLTKDVGKELPRKIDTPEPDGVEALLAMSETSGPLAPPLPPPGFSKSDRPPPPPQPPAVIPPSVAPPPKPEPAPVSEAPVSPLVPSHMLPKPEPEPPPRAQPKPRPEPAPPPAASSKRERLPPDGPPTSARRKTSGATGRTSGSFQEPRAPKTGMVMLVLALFVLVAGGIAIWKMNPAFFLGRKKPVTTPSASVSAALPPAPRCKVALVVSDVPANAEILLRMGQSPLDVERMPVGTRLEFVATAEGYAPRRAVIKGESPWDNGPDGKPRIDLPIQLDPSKAKPGQVDPWPAAEPGSQVGGSGSPGTVHVVSSVRGAEIWLLAGLGPEARIEQLRCDGDIDVLLAGPPSLRKRLRVNEKEIAAAQADPQGNKVVSVSAK